MREIEQKAIPLTSKGLTGDLRRLTKPTDSFLILYSEVISKQVIRSTAWRLGMRVVIRNEGDAYRVWRNFDVESQDDQTIERFLTGSKPQEPETILPPPLEKDQTYFAWVFTKDKSQFADDGQVYRKQYLASNPKQTRTVRVSEDDPDIVLD